MLGTLGGHYYEKEFGYQAEIMKKRLKYFHGYFQSPTYFEKYLQEICQSLQNKREPSREFISYLESFKEQKTLVLHIRRGDYLELDKYHGVLPISYYQEALGRFNLKEYKVVIVSNDIGFARDHFSSSYTFIGPAELPCAAENLILMSRASAIIGANSTLSLWAAIIMAASPAMKVFPEPWFKTKSIDTNSLVPIDYIRVKALY
jgi:hypothetical protein